MLRIELTKEIAADPERVFEVLSDHEGMVRWSGAREVVLRHPGDPPPNGLGAARVIRGSGVAFEEEIVGYDPPRRMEYRVVAGLPIREHHGEILVEPEGEGSCVVWKVRFRTLIPGTGWLFRRLIERTLDRALSGLDRFLASSPNPQPAVLAREKPALPPDDP
jgi:uncharacterized protein YndB with AHSA1/START domain